MTGSKLMWMIFATVLAAGCTGKKPGGLKSGLLDVFADKVRSGELGAAVLDLETGDTVGLNGTGRYPMQSVFKFPLAMAVLHEVDRGKLSLDQKIFVTPEDLLPDTWSPLREKYPQGNVHVTVDELLSLTVSLSDNNGCDILFRLLGGTEVVDRYVKSLGVTGMNIVADEEEMAKSWEVQYRNWCEPLAMVQLLRLFWEGNALSDTSTAYLRRIMEETTTGPARLKGLLPAGVRVAHKTGSSGTSTEGITAATNDAGIITGARGGAYAIAVFVKDSPDSQEAREGLIARVARVSWDYFEAK